MIYYHVPTNTARRPDKDGEPKLSDGYIIRPPEDRGWTHALAAVCGFVPILRSTRPAETATHTYVRSVEAGTAKVVTERQEAVAWDAEGEPTEFVTVQVPPIAEGRAVEVWTAVEKTQAEQDEEAQRAVEDANQSTLRSQAEGALTNNKAFLDSDPTNAEVVAQVDALTRQMNKVIRLVVGKFDDVA